MNLRHKFGILALFYVVTLAANVALCSWCLLLYYESFLHQVGGTVGVANAGSRPEPGSTPALAVQGAGLGEPTAADESILAASEGLGVRILGVNAACGIAIGILGLLLVRRWVIRPIAGLRDAAVKIGQGDLAGPLQVSGDDELGELGADVQSMAASIVQMRAQVVEQERRQVALQALRCIVHNIRSPLTGIRWVAEAVGSRSDVDAETLQEQGRIVQTVDETLSWLAEYRESLQGVGQIGPSGPGPAHPAS